MNNFLEVLDSDPLLTIGITVAAITENGMPRATIRVNGTCLFDNFLESSWTGSIQIPLLDPLVLEVVMSGKQHDAERETAVIVQNVTVDQCAVMPRFSHLVQYTHEQGFGPATSYLGFNGCWRLDTQQPFYTWWHNVTAQGWLLIPSVEPQE